MGIDPVEAALASLAVGVGDGWCGWRVFWLGCGQREARQLVELARLPVYYCCGASPSGLWVPTLVENLHVV